MHFFYENGAIRRDSKRTYLNKGRPDQQPNSHNDHLMLIVNEQRTLHRKEDVLTLKPDEDYVPPEMEHETPWDNLIVSDAHLIDRITIEGSPELRAELKRTVPVV